MNIFKQTLLSIFTAFVTMTLVYGGYTIYADDEDLDFRQPDEGILYVETTYHRAMNQYFNEKMERLVTILDGDQFEQNPDFNPPAEGEECTENNVSSYCVSMGATDMYVDLLETLDQMEGNPVQDPEDVSVSEVLRRTNQRDNEIARVIEESQLVLDATLATYNEFRLAYPMHKQYEQVMTNLINYRKSLEGIRNEVTHFPGKFIDASSSYCK